MLDRLYDLNKPADIRALLQASSWTRIALALCYWHNHCANSVGSAYNKRSTLLKRGDAVKAEYNKVLGEVFAGRKLAYRQKLKQLLDMHGFKIKYRQMSGAVSRIERKPIKRGVPNTTPGSIVNINQQGLFPFSDLYSQEAIINLLIMSE